MFISHWNFLFGQFSCFSQFFFLFCLLHIDLPKLFIHTVDINPLKTAHKVGPLPPCAASPITYFKVFVDGQKLSLNLCYLYTNH